MADLGLAVIAAAGAASQGLLALRLRREADLGPYRAPLWVLFALNGAVAAVFAARAVVGFGEATSTERVLGSWASLLDGPTTLLIIAMALQLLGAWPARSGTPALLLAWLAQPVWMLANLGVVVPDPIGLVYAWLLVHGSYALLLVAAASRMSTGGLDSRVAFWLLAAFGPRAVELAVLDAPSVATWWAQGAWVNNLLPFAALTVGVVVALGLIVARRRDLGRPWRLAAALLLLGAVLGTGYLLSRDTAGLHVTFLSSTTLFILRPLVFGGGLLGLRGLVLAAAPFAYALLAAALLVLVDAAFAPLPGTARALLAAATAMVMLVALWTSSTARGWLGHGGGSPGADVRVHQARAALATRYRSPSDPGLVALLRREPQPTRVLLALRGTDGPHALYDAASSHAGLCAVAGVNYKKLAAVLQRLEEAHFEPALPLVLEYGAGRSKYYRLSPRGARVAAQLARRTGVDGMSPEELRTALLAAAQPSDRGSRGPGAPSPA